MYPDILAAMMLQAATSPPIQYPTVTEFITGAAAVGATILNLKLAANQARADVKAKEDAEKLRQELVSRMENVTATFSTKLDQMAERFVPGNIDIERRSILNSQVTELKSEVLKNRDRIHEQANKVQEMLLGPIENIHTSLRDKAKRLTALEERDRLRDDRSRAVDDQLRDIEDRIAELERKGVR